ncbi:hypothetical protein [Streptomyces sp. NPDC049590]|uniref:hypothetical protein n=1 Tax=Streptomyces sp. NPDC049590 TaxID=3154834 RepID=UPI0034361DC6
MVRTRLKLTRDGDAFLLLGAGREAVDALLERLAGPDTVSRDVRLTPRELHMVHSALTAAPTMFLVPGGVFAEEPFHIRPGFYRADFDTLAHAVAQAVAEV